MTLRAIIGTVAVLAGFAVVERSVGADAGRAGPCKSGQPATQDARSSAR